MCGTALCGKDEMYVGYGLHLSGTGAGVFCRGTVRGGCQWLGYSTVFKLVGQGACQRTLKTYKMIADAMEYRGTHHNLE